LFQSKASKASLNACTTADNFKKISGKTKLVLFFTWISASGRGADCLKNYSFFTLNFDIETAIADAVCDLFSKMPENPLKSISKIFKIYFLIIAYWLSPNHIL
jgi:hypothetical protein